MSLERYMPSLHQGTENLSIIPKESLMCLCSQSHLPHVAPFSHWPPSITILLPFLEFSRNEIIWYVDFISGFFLLAYFFWDSAMGLHVSAVHSFLLLSGIPPYPSFFFHLPVDGRLGGFHFLAIMNNAIMSIHVQVVAQTYVFVSHE